MVEDLKLAAGLLAQNKKWVKQFRRRFQDRARMAFDHCMRARELGLEFDQYFESTGLCAAKSLLSSMPASPRDASIEPHVVRVLGHRDFALIPLLSAGKEEAWAVFRRRYGRYLRSLFIRSGHSPTDARALLDELVTELKGTEPDQAPIRGYQGRCDLNDWLFVYVRSRFRGGMHTQDPEAPVPEVDAAKQPGNYSNMTQHTMAMAVVPVDIDLELLKRNIDEVFATLFAELSPHDARLLEILATGGTLRAVVASGILAAEGKMPDSDVLLGRHHELVNRVFSALVPRVAARHKDSTQARIAEVIQDLTLSHLGEELMPVCGAIAE